MKIIRTTTAITFATTGAFLATGLAVAVAASVHSGGTAPLRGATVAHQAPACHGYKTYGVPSVAPLDPHKTYQAVVVTNKGTFTITFFSRQAPVTVQSFVFLAQHRYFDGVVFHRVMPGFVIQGGDPTGTGECGPGYQFGTENTGQTYSRGAVAMARTEDPHSNGSQFFVVLQDRTSLDAQPNYSLFGHVTSGMNAVDAIAGVPLGQSPTGEDSAPQVKVYMKSVRIVVK